MENQKYWILLVFVVFVALQGTSVHTQGDQSGFISIDCGIPDGFNYTDPRTGIFYTSDAGFIDTGVSESISHFYLNNFVAEYYATLRSFPEGRRNCYTIRTTQGKGHRYLIRASFMYGNYDGKNQTTVFDLHLGADFWATVNITSASTRTWEEIVHNPSSDYIYVCLVKTGAYTPFISAIELRLLEDTMYTTPDKSLSLFGRSYFGSLEGSDPIRYKDDIYDRLWSDANGFFTNQTLISNSTVDTSNATFTQPPPKVMSTAVVALNINQNLSFFWSLADRNISADKFYIFLHFAELEQLRGEQFREFNIYLNGRLWYGPLAPEYLKAKTIHHQIPEQGLQALQFQINKTASSTLPPLVNAVEVYTAIEFSESRTEDMNVAAMLDIKSAYKLTRRNWQGDPCVPQTFVWDGLNCSYDGVNPATVTSLNLSSFGLNGSIASSISNLTSLQTLDLSNNNLTGQVPQFLAELASLKVLNLKGNFFNGTIPERLLEKSNSGTLLLSIDDLIKSTDKNPNSAGKNMVVIRVIASLSAALLIVLTIDL